MKKQIKTTKKEMTVSEIGNTVIEVKEMVIKLADTVGNLSNTVEQLSIATAKGFEAVNSRIDNVEVNLESFKIETNENFRQVRHSILHGHDVFATKDDVAKLSFRVKALEKSK